MKVTFTEVKNKMNKRMVVNECLNEIKPYLRDITIDLQNSGTWKIQLAITIYFVSSKNVDEEHVMYSKKENTEFVTYKNVNDVVDELFEWLITRYQDALEASMRGSNFIFDSVQLLCYKCHRINFKRGGSYIKSPDWIKNKKSNNKSEKQR